MCLTIVSVGLWIGLSAAAPWVLSDKNTFLLGFVNHEFLGFMGVIVTITMASVANLHIELNKLEERVERAIFTKTKRSLKDSARALIVMLSLAVVIVVAKPLMNEGERSQALINGAALLIIIFSIMTLVDLTKAALSLEPVPKK